MSSTETTATITVIQAAYGAVQGTREVTGIVQDLVNQKITTFVANNETLGGDPAQGHDKHFGMNYKVGSSVYSFACKEGQTVTLRTQENQPEITVIGAAYGTIDPNNPRAGSRDVTAIVQEILDSGRREFEPDNELFGDPIEGPRKNFGMTYASGDGGARKAIASNEGQKVRVS